MLPVACVVLALSAEPTTTFTNRLGTHTVKVADGEGLHALGDGRFGSLNDETARWPKAGNRLTGVVAVAGSGFAGLDDVMVLAVDKDGGVWATARLPNGAWLPWGSVSRETGYSGKAVGVSCTSTGRTLTVTLREADGTETTVTRKADGTWAK